MQELGFIKKILNYTGPKPQPVWQPYVSPFGVRIGYAMFSAQVTDSLSIDEGTSLDIVFERLDALQLPGGLTNIYA